MRVQWDGRVAEVVIDRPEARNAINQAVADDLHQVLDELEAAAPGAVVIRGAGTRVFVSGGDLKELASIRDEAPAAAMAMRMRHVLDRIARFPAPVIAAVNGDAYGGGGEVALACDFRIAADDVRVGFTQVTLGIMPAWGGVERLCALVGRARALYLLTTGHVVDGPELAAWGLAEEVVARGDFDRRWRAVAHALGEAPPIALDGIKSVVGAVDPGTHPASEQAAIEAFARAWVAETHWDAVERQAERRRQRGAGRRPSPPSVPADVHCAIGELLARYCERVDEYDIDGVAATFAEDCVVDYGPGRGGEVLGRQATRNRIAAGQAEFRRTHHQLGQYRAVPTGEGGYRVVTYVTAWHERWDGRKETLCLRYLDRVVDSPDGLVLAERRVHAAVTHGFDGVPWVWVPRALPPERIGVPSAQAPPT